MRPMATFPLRAKSESCMMRGGELFPLRRPVYPRALALSCSDLRCLSFHHPPPPPAVMWSVLGTVVIIVMILAIVLTVAWRRRRRANMLLVDTDGADAFRRPASPSGYSPSNKVHPADAYGKRGIGEGLDRPDTPNRRLQPAGGGAVPMVADNRARIIAWRDMEAP
jgi:hypothetical protein